MPNLHPRTSAIPPAPPAGAYFSLSHDVNMPTEIRIARALSTAGASITITSATDVVAFVVRICIE